MKMDSLKIEHHIKHLEALHKDVDDKLKKEEKHYGNDEIVRKLKKEKLRLKDEIETTKKLLCRK